MAISINCSKCGKHYQAADHMAGRTVRCKDCGTTFQLPAEAVDASLPFKRPDEVHVAAAQGALPVIDPLAPPSRAAAAAAAVVAARAAAAAANAPGGARGGPQTNEPPDADDARVDLTGVATPEDVFDEAFQDFTPARGNTPFVFPGSQVLDQWLPAVLVVLSVAWLAYQVLSADPNEPGWVGIVRLLVLLMTYSGVMFPICLTGVRMAARKLNYELPSGAPFRAFSTFLLPVTIGCIVWLSSSTVAGFIFGTVMGLIVALPIMWLLFRIRPDDAPVSLGFGAGAFGVAIVGAVVLLSVLNLILVGVVRGAKSQHALARSPFGPGFTWDGPTIVEPPPKRVAPPPAPDEPIEGETPVADGGPPPPPPDGAADPGAPATAPAGPPAVAAGPNGTDGPMAVAPAPGVPGDAAQLLPGAEAEVLGQVVGDVQERVTGKLRQVVYPVLPGTALAVVREGAGRDEDQVELWESTAWEAMVDATFPRDAAVSPDYALSSDGSYLARVTNWPYPSVQVHSFLKGKVLKPFIKLESAARPPRILGFSGKDQVAVMYRTDDGAAVDLWDVNKVTRKRLKLSAFEPDLGNYAFSRDGKHLAVLVREPNQAGRVEVYNMTAPGAGKVTRRIPINGLQWGPGVKSTGLCFNDEGDKLAMLLESGGKGLFLCWGPKGDKPIHDHVYPGGLVPEGASSRAFQGERFALVDQGRAWVLYGANVFDSVTGKQLGNIGIKGVYGQKVASPSTVLLVKQVEGAGAALVEVRLDLDRARKAVASTP